MKIKLTFALLFATFFLSFTTPSMASAAAAAAGGEPEADKTMRLSGFSLDDIFENLDLIGEVYRVSDGNEDAEARLDMAGFNVLKPCEKEERLFILTRERDIHLIYLGAAAEDLSDCKKFFGTHCPYFCAGRIHRGFVNRFEQSWDDTYMAIRRYADFKDVELTDLTFKLAGHSMGGALASLAALRLGVLSFDNQPMEHVQLVTFGSPRVFDCTGAAQYESVVGGHTLRVIHDGEGMVPLLPTDVNGSRHVGKCFITPVPGVDEFSPTPLRHTFPAYRSSLKKATEEDMIAALDLAPDSSFVGTVLSRLKGALGTPRFYLNKAMAKEPIEFRGKNEELEREESDDDEDSENSTAETDE